MIPTLFISGSPSMAQVRGLPPGTAWLTCTWLLRGWRIITSIGLSLLENNLVNINKRVRVSPGNILAHMQEALVGVIHNNLDKKLIKS